MSKVLSILLEIYLLITPLFRGLYYEKYFVTSSLFLLTILILCISIQAKDLIKNESKDKNKNINKDEIENKDINTNIFWYIGDKKILIAELLILITFFITYLSRVFVYNEAVKLELFLYGLFQLLEFIILYFLLVRIKQDNSINNDEKSNNMRKYIVFSGILLCLFMISKDYYRNGRFESLFAYANATAIYIFMCFGIMQRINLNKFIKIFLDILFLTAILLTNSRIVYIIVILYILLTYIFKRINKKRISNKGIKSNFDNAEHNSKKEQDRIERFDLKKKKSYFTLIIAFLITILICCIFIGKHSYKLFDENDLAKRFKIDTIVHDIDLRMSYITEALDIIKSNPLGTGYEGYLKFQKIKENKYILRLVHNFIVQSALNYGIIMTGLMLYLICIYFMKVNRKIKNKNRININKINENKTEDNENNASCDDLFNHGGSQEISNRILNDNLIISLVMIHCLFDVGMSFLVIPNVLIFLFVDNYYEK